MAAREKTASQTSSENKVYGAEFPEDLCDSESGIKPKALIANLYYSLEIYRKHDPEAVGKAGVVISAGEISNILTRDKKDEFAAEKQAIFESGMGQARYFHIDDTSARHKGTKHYPHVVCDEKFTTFFILLNKNRDTIRGILGLGDGEQTDKIMVSDDGGGNFWRYRRCMHYVGSMRSGTTRKHPTGENQL